MNNKQKQEGIGRWWKNKPTKTIKKEKEQEETKKNTKEKAHKETK